MSKIRNEQEGFVLIVALILLAAISLFAINGMGLTIMSERMAGNYMERSLAKSTAEQAITQGIALLQTNGATCVSAGCTNANMLGTAAEHNLNTLPSAWSNVDIKAVISPLVGTSGSFRINWLSNAAFAKVDCQPYSVMGLGVGKNSQTAVLLQTIAYVCPTD